MANLPVGVLSLPHSLSRRIFDALAPSQAPKWCSTWPERRGKRLLHKDWRLLAGGAICQRGMEVKYAGEQAEGALEEC
jgi:hypothetical protein